MTPTIAVFKLLAEHQELQLRIEGLTKANAILRRHLENILEVCPMLDDETGHFTKSIKDCLQQADQFTQIP